MILATILFCVSGRPDDCPVRHQFRLDARACAAVASLGSRAAEIPSGGEWRKARVRIRCSR